MKHFRTRFLLVLLFSLLLCVTASAVGDGNVDGGGGNMGEGNIAGGSFWNEEDGIRITVLRTQNGSKVSCFDWTNYNEDSVDISFIKHSKLDYRHGYNLTPTELYTYKIPDAPLPTIVGRSGNSIPAIKRYFTGEEVLTDIATQSGLSYEDLTGGDYKLLLEPMAYFNYNGVKYAMTATEAAHFDVLKNGDLRYWMGRLTHQNLPLAMFLEHPDEELGLYVWTGATSGKQNNADIINYMGMGIVSFEEPPEADDTEYDYVFRCDTDVIISIPMRNFGQELTPDENATVRITVGGQSFTQRFICPAGGTQLVWIPWHTPDDPEILTVTARVSAPRIQTNVTSASLSVSVEKLEEKTPPDPTYYDRGHGFSLTAPPDYGNNLTTSWRIWEAEWVSLGLAGGYWSFYQVLCNASLSVTYDLSPDDRCQTDYESYPYGTVMPSGYGIQVKVNTSTRRSENTSSAAVTSAQNVVATFPEFDYQTYDRILEETRTGEWHFKESPYSLYQSRIHYTPLWYPDDTYYPVAICVFDAWTPGGQLYATLSDDLYIYQSCLDDWYIHVVE